MTLLAAARAPEEGILAGPALHPQFSRVADRRLVVSAVQLCTKIANDLVQCQQGTGTTREQLAAE